MSQHTVISLNKLDDGLVLIPERYDPRRYNKNHTGTLISDVASVVNDQVKLKKRSDKDLYLVLDTSDASDGFIRSKKEPVPLSDIKSAKKIIRAGDVIISRLRPYLRQVAYVDSLLSESYGKEVFIVCSTEFYVLRSKGENSIAFLVPFLLSDVQQEIFSLSQEGGHHPRFSHDTLEKIAIPDSLIKNRTEISKAVESSVEKARSAYIQIKSLIGRCSQIASKTK